MDTEYEATFWPVEREWILEQLKNAGASLIYPDRFMRRFVFHPPLNSNLGKAWGRVRDEGDKVTLSIKRSGTTIADQKEIEIAIDDFDTGVTLMKEMGWMEKAYQETRRELWTLDEVSITIDTWPFIPLLVEVEGSSEEAVRSVAEKLSFKWDDAIFESIDVLYAKHYGIEDSSAIRANPPQLAFSGPNPFEQ